MRQNKTLTVESIAAQESTIRDIPDAIGGQLRDVPD